MANPRTLDNWIEELQPMPLHEGKTIRNDGLKEIRDYLIQLKQLIGGQNGTKYNQTKTQSH